MNRAGITCFGTGMHGSDGGDWGFSHRLVWCFGGRGGDGEWVLGLFSIMASNLVIIGLCMYIFWRAGSEDGKKQPYRRVLTVLLYEIGGNENGQLGFSQLT